MHRSITLSEIVSSTFTNNVPGVDYRSKKQKFATKVGIGLIEFLACSMYQCYGILLGNYVEIREYKLEKAAWTTLIYLSAWCITDPWSKWFMKHLEEKKYFRYQVIICISSILLAVGMIIPPHYLCYGIFGGLFSNIIYVHLKRISRKKYKTTEKAFEGNIQSSRAISLLIMPHILLLLVSNFSSDRALQIYAGIILLMIPAVFIIRLPKEEFTGYGNTEKNRYQTLPAFSQQMKEMKVFSTSGNTSDINYSTTSANDNQSSEDDDQSDDDNEEEEDDDLLVHEKANFEENEKDAPVMSLNPVSVQNYYRQAGVSILPEIPEEEEVEVTNVNIIDPKRLSRISITLEQLNIKERRDSLKELVVTKEIVPKPEPIQNIEYISNYTQDKTGFIKDMKFSKKYKCCSCSPYTLFVWKRRMRTWKDFLIDCLFVPVFRTAKNLHFYPTLFTKVTTTISSILFISLTPYMALKKNDGYRREDMAFLLSYIAFSWCLSLILLPLLMGFSAVKLRITFIVGLVLSGCSMLLLTKRKMTNDFITWSALLFGFGYGLTKFTENLVYRAFAGHRNYVKFDAILNVLTGIFVILIYYLLYINDIELVVWFPLISSIVYFVNAVMWIVASPVKEVLIFLSKYFVERSDSTSIL